MYLLIFSLSLSCITAQQLPQKSYNGKDHLSRREMSYTSNIFHGNPHYLDQQAESNVQVELGNYKSNPPTHHKPRSSHSRPHRPYKMEENKPPPSHRTKIVKYFDQSHQGSHHQSSKIVPKPSGSQLYNVGYSVSFSKNAKKPKPVRDDEPDVIRGTNTGLVQKPDSQEFVSNSISEIKRPRIKNKVKQNKYRSSYGDLVDPDIVLLSQKTRQSYAGLGHPQISTGFNLDEPSHKKERNRTKPLRISLNTNPSKPISGEQPSIHQEMINFLNSQPPDQVVKSQSSNQNNYPETAVFNSYQVKLQHPNIHKGHNGRVEEDFVNGQKVILSSNNRIKAPGTQAKKINWKNLGPNVEIYHSPELPPETFRFDPSEHLEQSKKFDHARALGRSQGFDYSNALAAQEGFEVSKENVTESSAEESRPIEVSSNQQPEQSKNTYSTSQNDHTFSLEPQNNSPQILGASTAALTGNPDVIRSAPSYVPNFNVVPIDASLIPMHFDATLLQLAPPNGQEPLFSNGGGYIPQFHTVAQPLGLNNLIQFNTGVRAPFNNFEFVQQSEIQNENGDPEVSQNSQKIEDTFELKPKETTKNLNYDFESNHKKNSNFGSRTPITFDNSNQGQIDESAAATNNKPAVMKVAYRHTQPRTTSLWPLLSNERNKRFIIRV